MGAGDPALSAEWENRNITDDPVVGSNTLGTLSYATAGPNTRTTQLFINLANNSFLDSQGFSPFGRVVAGMDVVVGGISAQYGQQPSQQLIYERGNKYLEREFPG